ncbi:MAG: hypothetical protein WDO72_13735 [Pseudomonadota bacterium]
MMNWRVVTAATALAAVLLLRFVLDVVFLLPSPVGDSEFFLTASVNLCSDGFFGTTVYPIDPTGQARMIWHGFVSPMLYSTLNTGCSARGYYLVAWGIQLLTCASVLLLLARARGLSFVPAVGMAFLTLAAQVAIGFRPEALAVLLIVLAEIALQYRQYAVFGAIAGILACTQPTVAAIYAVSMLLLRPELLRQWLPAAGGGIAAVLLLFWIYPFPAADLLTGILLQGKKLIGRGDGSLVSYYLLQPSLPAWGLLLLGTAALAARKRPMLLLITPLVWFLGPRVPPVFYNLIPLCILLVAFCLATYSARIAGYLGMACLLVGATGLGFVSLRDVLTAQRFGDTFAQTRAQVAALVAGGTHLAHVSSIVALTNPELAITNPRRVPAPAGTGGAEVSIVAVNGAPRAPCAVGTRDVSLGLGTVKLFNSNSGWMIYVCR